VGGVNLVKLNLSFPATVLNQRTAVLKLAARGRIERARYIASKGCPRALDGGFGHRCRLQQSSGVGMEMLAVYRLCWAVLHNVSKIHDGDIVANVLDHIQVVGYKEIAQAQPFL
jgi:hypothetical protein